jgi:hypothetical protein
MSNFFGKIVDSIGCIGVASIIITVFGCGFIHAQSVDALEDLNTVNSLATDEGVRPIQDLDCLSHGSNLDSTSDTTTSPSKKEDFILPTSSITDSAIRAIDINSGAWKAARITRTADAPKTHYAWAAIESIYPNNKQKIQEIVYGKTMTVSKIVDEELAKKIANSKKKVSAYASAE